MSTTTFSAVLPTSLPALSTIVARAGGLLLVVRSYFLTRQYDSLHLANGQTVLCHLRSLQSLFRPLS